MSQMILDWHFTISREHYLPVGRKLSETVYRSRKLMFQHQQRRIMSIVVAGWFESGTRARVDGRLLDCRRSERTADRWWVESESTDLPDSCEPTKRALSSPVLSRSPRAASQPPARPFWPVGMSRTKSRSHTVPPVPSACVGDVLARTCWTTKRQTADQRPDRSPGGSDLHRLRFHSSSTDWTGLAWLSA